MSKLPPELKSVKGMPDQLPEITGVWGAIEKQIRDLMADYGYREIRLPILEKTALFKRSIGEATDIVEKEMFTFHDQKDRSLSMRPEGTASCVRACLEHSLIRNQQQQRLWYMGPMFRYEEPQEGRYRQFYQLGVETLSLPGPDVEVEHIAMMARLWKRLGLADVIRLEINSLGQPQSRKAYREALVEYFSAHQAQLDADSQRRLTTNPLRILDSKNPDMQALIEKAPTIEPFLDQESRTHFETFKQYLDSLGVAYHLNPRLVRGLDYYNRTIYEWTTDRLGAQSAVCAGGRYDGLVEQLGGDATPAVGFALGIERIILLLQKTKTLDASFLDAYLITLGDEAVGQRLKLAETMRDHAPGLRLLTHCGEGSFKNQFKKADKSGAKLALIVGEDELANQTVTIKSLREEREQVTVKMVDLGIYLGGESEHVSN